MLIAKRKKEENIAEYLLYMWQIEDIIRAYKFDINGISENLIKQFEASDELRKEITEWYDNLLHMMLNEKIREKGHLQINQNILLELERLHIFLLEKENDMFYIQTYQKAYAHIQILKEKQEDKNISEIELCFNALYLILLLKLQKKEVSKDTMESILHISELLRVLSLKYKEKKDLI